MALPIIGLPYGPLPAAVSHTIPVNGPYRQIEVLEAGTSQVLVPASIDYSVPGQITVTFFVARSIFGRIY